MPKMLIMLSVIAVATLLTGCGTVQHVENGPQYMTVQFPTDEPVKPLARVENRNNPNEVINFARSLSKAGRHEESAKIYLDAAKRFHSNNGTFELDCRMAAVKEYWYAGDLAKARKELKVLEGYQDIYSYSSETNAVRKLRKLLENTSQLQKEFEKAENSEA